MRSSIPKGFFPFFLILFLGTVTPISWASPVSFSKGMLVFSDGDFQKALGLFEEAYKAEPDNPDHTYFLGLTHLRLNHFPQASKYLKELLDKNPDYSKAYFDYALSLLRQKNYKEALFWFKKATDKEPRNPLPLFYVGVALYHEGIKSEALRIFKNIEEIFPKSEVAQTAKEWVTKIETGEELQIAPTAVAEEKLKQWSLKGATSFFYDSNVSLDPDEENLAGFQNNQDDIMGSGALDLRYLFHTTGNTKAGIEYSGYQSFYGNMNFDLNRFNYGRHKSGVNLQHKISDNLQLRLPINFTYTFLGATRYLMSGAGESYVDFAWKNKWLTTFSGKIRRDDFFANPTNAAQSRDALKVNFGVDQYYFFPNKRDRYLKGGYEFERNFAKGNDWEYKGHRASFVFHTPLIWGINFLSQANIGILRKFNNKDSVFNVKRGDFNITGLASLSREIIPHLTASVSYTYAFTDSNIRRFTYHRHIAGFSLTTNF